MVSTLSPSWPWRRSGFVPDTPLRGGSCGSWCSICLRAPWSGRGSRLSTGWVCPEKVVGIAGIRTFTLPSGRGSAPPRIDGPATHFLKSLTEENRKRGIQLILVQPNKSVVAELPGGPPAKWSVHPLHLLPQEVCSPPSTLRVGRFLGKMDRYSIFWMK